MTKKIHEYAMDVRLNAAVRVKAESRSEAIRLLRDNVDCSGATLGSWPDGTPINAEVSVDEDDPICFEVDGSTDHPDVD